MTTEPRRSQDRSPTSRSSTACWQACETSEPPSCQSNRSTSRTPTSGHRRGVPPSGVARPHRTAHPAPGTREDDAEPTWRFRRQESVGRWLTAVPHSLEDYRATFEEPDRLATTLIVEREGKVIGDLMLKIEDAWAQTEVAVRARGVQAELGWVLDPAHTGHGYETEAVRELLRLCFDELDLRRVVAKCFSDNEASWRLMERLGMRRELHAVRESLHRSGEWLDVYGYARRVQRKGGTA